MPFVNHFGKFQDLQCGLIHIIRGLPVPVPLRKVHLNVKIVDFVAEVSIVQDYVNAESNPIEVQYSYPVEESAAIIGFEATIDGTEIEAIVKGKEEAKAEYDQAMRQGNSAILLDETAPDIFSMKLGQLKPGAGAQVKLTYIMELPVEDKYMRLSVPTTIAPRYIPPTDNSEAAQEIAKLTYNSNGAKTPLIINIETFMKSKIKKITSPSHDLKTEMKNQEQGQFHAISTLNDFTDVMDRDLVVLIDGEDQGTPVVFVEEMEDSVAAMVSLIPSFKLDEQKTELIFLVDRSGSMGWNEQSSIEQAKKALQLFLHSMPSNCYFNIWSFGSQFSSLFPTSQKYDDDTLAQAKSHVLTMEANYGGTEVFAPLKSIFEQKAIKDYAKQIFLLTDGAVSNDQQVISLVKNNGLNSRVFTLGLGASASRHLVKGVARAGNGSSIFATLQEDLRPKVLTLLKNALMPSLTNVQVLWNDEKLKDGNGKEEIQQKRTLLGFNKPKKSKKIAENEGDKIGVLFDGSRMLHFKTFEKDFKLSKVTVTAQAPDGPLSIEVPIDDTCHLQAGKFLHQMATRRKIQDIEDDGLIHESKDEVKTLALKYGIASKFTSFIGVDKSTRKPLLEPAMQTRHVSQEVPRGFGGGFAFGSAPRMAMMPSYSGSKLRSVQRSAPPPMMMMCQQPKDQMQSGSLFGTAASVAISREMIVPESEEESSKVYDCDSDESQNDMSFSLFDSTDSTENLQPKVVKDPLEALIDLQLANGSFKYGSGLGLSEEELKKSCPESISNEVWMTAYVIGLLAKKFAKDKDLWELVANKAKNFVKTKLVKMDYDQLMIKVQSLL
eukprot:12859.XXX_910098_907486_1 [CDS] Oithona nana genome sequencing.